MLAKDHVQRKTSLLLVLALIVGALGVLSHAPTRAEASSGFDAENIISDQLFYDGNALNVTGVQAFLNARVPRCTIGDPKKPAGGIYSDPAGWSIRLASSCLRDGFFTSRTMSADRYCSAYVGNASESAAQIVARVGSACGISQKVLLVMLEKEQALVQDTFPAQHQLDRAMGYACPDSGVNFSASCDLTYYGFFNQVYFAARQLKIYKAFPDSYRYKPFQVNDIQWHPNPACGTSRVNIQNWATAALYIYTPYRPNAAALAAGSGLGDSCSAYGNRNFFNFFTNWFGSTQGVDLSPVGQIERVEQGPKQATVAGFAFDPETSAPIEVHYYIGGIYGLGAWGGRQVADQYSETVATRYTSYGAKHGFTIHLPNLNGPTKICMYAINVGQGDTRLLECREVSPATGGPFGNYESLKLEGGSAIASGWAIDPDDIGQLSIHAYFGNFGEGRWAGMASTGEARSDVAKVYPAYGANTGFRLALPVPVGTSDVCLYAVDREQVSNTFMGCRTVSTASGPPIGSLDQATASVEGATLNGWALDPDTPDPIQVHAYVDGRWAGAHLANLERPDVARAYPGYGSTHGYSIRLSGLSEGTRTICMYGIDVRGTSNTLLACQKVQVPSGNPIGNFEELQTGVEGVGLARGWVMDPDGNGLVQVHAYLNGGWLGSYVADHDRTDVGRAYPGAGNTHGFQFPVMGSGNLCIYAINVGIGTTNPLLGCRAF